MAYQHKKQAAGEWQNHSFLFQMANIGSEVSRALKWRTKNKTIAQHAFERSLELFDLTAADPKNRGSRLKEVLRAREAWADFFVGDNIYRSTAQQWEKYFFAFAWAARREQGK